MLNNTLYGHACIVIMKWFGILLSYYDLLDNLWCGDSVVLGDEWEGPHHVYQRGGWGCGQPLWGRSGWARGGGGGRGGQSHETKWAEVQSHHTNDLRSSHITQMTWGPVTSHKWTEVQSHHTNDLKSSHITQNDLRSSHITQNDLRSSHITQMTWGPVTSHKMT